MSSITSSVKYLARLVATGIYALTLILLLVACGGQPGSKHSGNSNTTLHPAQPLATPTALLANNVSFKRYTGPGFSILYPIGWQITASSGEAAFTDATGNYNLTVGFSPNPNGLASPDQLADGGAAGAQTSLTDEHTISIAKTATIDGQAWSQRAVTGTSALGPGNDIEAVVLAANHPTKAASTRGFVIVYVAAKNALTQAKNTYFLPMLQSFTFTS